MHFSEVKNRIFTTMYAKVPRDVFNVSCPCQVIVVGPQAAALWAPKSSTDRGRLAPLKLKYLPQALALAGDLRTPGEIWHSPHETLHGLPETPSQSTWDHRALLKDHTSLLRISCWVMSSCFGMLGSEERIFMVGAGVGCGRRMVGRGLDMAGAQEIISPDKKETLLSAGSAPFLASSSLGCSGWCW